MMSSTFDTQNRGKQRTPMVLLIGCVLVILCSLITTPVVGASLQPGDFEITNSASGDTVDADSSLKIRWSASAASDGYKIALRDLTTDQKLLDNADIGSTKSYTIRNLGPGHVYRVAVCAYGAGLTDRWEECEFSVAEVESDPEIRSLDVTPSEGRAGLDYFTFTVKTNEYVGEVSIEVDGYSVGTTSQFRGSSTRTFTIPDMLLTSPGINRNVVADAYGSNGDVVTESTTINVIATEPAGVPIILSPSDGSIHVLGDTLSVSWLSPPTNPTSYNVYLYYNGGVVFSEMDHSGTSITIPVRNIQSVGTYSIEVYANKRGYSTDAPGNVFISAIEIQEPVTQIPATTVPTTQKPVTQIPATTVPTTQKPVTQIPATTVPTTQEPITQIPATTVHTTHATVPSHTTNPNDYLEPNPAGTVHSQLGAEKTTSSKSKINKIKVNIDNGLFGSGLWCIGKYKITIETNRDTEKVQFDIPEKEIYNVILDDYEDKNFFFFSYYREFTWEPTNIDKEFWLYEGKTYTVKAYVSDGTSKMTDTEKSIQIKGTQPDNIGSLLP